MTTKSKYSFKDKELDILSRKNNDKINKKLYMARRPDIVLKKRQNWYNKNKALENKRSIEKKKRDKESLKDLYIKKLLIDRTGLSSADLTPELINLKRTELILKNYGKATTK